MAGNEVLTSRRPSPSKFLEGQIMADQLETTPALGGQIGFAPIPAVALVVAQFDRLKLSRLRLGRSSLMLARPSKPSILLAEAEIGSGIAVKILPSPMEVGHDRVFAGYLNAHAYARLLWMHFGWRTVDRCDNKTKPAARKHG